MAIGILSLPISSDGAPPLRYRVNPGAKPKGWARDGGIKGRRFSQWSQEFSSLATSCSRTSTGMFMRRGQDKIIGDIEKRIADFTFIPVEHGEGLQVLRYEVGQKNLPHYDTDTSVEGPINENGGPRIATVLMYLSDVEEGGETVFPSAKGDAMSKHRKKGLKHHKGGLTVKPKMGDALLFWSIKPDGTLDPSSLHGGDPVIKGTKWACTKWLHAQEYKV